MDFATRRADPYRNTPVLSPSKPCLLLIFLLIVRCPARAGFLFRASPGYDGVRPAGLWGGMLNHDDHGQGQDLFSIGYEEIEMPSSYIYDGIRINTLSYDPHTMDALVEVVDTLENINIVGRGKICPKYTPFLRGKPSPSLPLRTVIPDVALIDSNHPFLFDSECGWKCGWGSFALFNDRIYFILTGVYGLRSSSLRRKIQIRVLNSNCDALIAKAIKYGQSNTDFPVLNCSDHVATVLDEPYTRPNPNLETWVASPLKVVQTAAGRSLCFYLQLLQRADCDVTMNLIQICEDSGEAVWVHSATLPSIYGGNSRIRGFGSIDYKDGMLCWTAAEELLCGPIAEDRVSLVSIVLPPGAAVEAGICTGELPLAKVISGVTVAHAAPLRVYFGCYSQLAGHGGAGLVEINLSASTEIVKNIYEVTSNGRKVYASGLFYVDTLCGSCKGPTCVTDQTTKYSGRTVPNSGVTASTTLRWMERSPVDGALTGSAWTIVATFITVLSLLANSAFVVFITD